MLARVIAGDDQDNVVVETNWVGCFVAQFKGRRLEVNDYFGGPVDHLQDSEIEVQPLPYDSLCRSFKLSQLRRFPNAEQALNELRSNPSAKKLRLRVPPYRTPVQNESC